MHSSIAPQCSHMLPQRSNLRVQAQWRHAEDRCHCSRSACAHTSTGRRAKADASGCVSASASAALPPSTTCMHRGTLFSISARQQSSICTYWRLLPHMQGKAGCQADGAHTSDLCLMVSSGLSSDDVWPLCTYMHSCHAMLNTLATDSALRPRGMLLVTRLHFTM